MVSTSNSTVKTRSNAMGDYRVPNEGQYHDKSNGEIVLGIPDDLTEKRISEVSSFAI